VSYVRLKHALSAVALEVVAHPERAGIAEALLAYARGAVPAHRLPVDALARAAGMPAAEVAERLQATGLFAAPDAETISLLPPFRPHLPYLRRQAARTAVAVRMLRMSHRPGIPPHIWRAAALFNAGLFFECHEYLEGVWRAAAGADRLFYHGLVQAAAGCYHAEKGNAHGARTLLAKAAAKLAPYGPVHLDVDVAVFVRGLRETERRLEASSAAPRGPDPATAPPLPTLDLVASPRAAAVRICAPAAVSRGEGRAAGG
jgi:hypothetical protein